jgi:copper chaperone CopZ
MKNFSILTAVLFLMLSACSEGSKQQASGNASAETVITHKEMAGDAVRTVASLSIEGMTCSAGCGGKIQQDLRAMNGVITTDLDFAEDRKENVVKVEFDPAKLNEQQLISCVHQIADGQYRVKSAEVVSYKSEGTAEGGSGGGSEMNTDQLGRAFQVLNLLQTMSGMIRE